MMLYTVYMPYYISYIKKVNSIIQYNVKNDQWWTCLCSKRVIKYKTHIHARLERDFIKHGIYIVIWMIVDKCVHDSDGTIIEATYDMYESAYEFLF